MTLSETGEALAVGISAVERTEERIAIAISKGTDCREGSQFHFLYLIIRSVAAHSEAKLVE